MRSFWRGNDAARAEILRTPVKQPIISPNSSPVDVRFDIVWKTAQAMNLVKLEDSGQSVIAKRIAGTKLAASDAANAVRAKEAVQAFEAIEQQRAAWPDGIDDLEYAFS